VQIPCQNIAKSATALHEKSYGMNQKSERTENIQKPGKNFVQVGKTCHEPGSCLLLGVGSGKKQGRQTKISTVPLGCYGVRNF